MKGASFCSPFGRRRLKRQQPVRNRPIREAPPAELL
jgi:hypothetical protein